MTCANRDFTTFNKKKPLLFPAPSAICPAFGLFAGEDISNGRYICEYLGELISEQEGERRGQLADIWECNYLYNITNNQDIDARLIGSWMKLVNNSFGQMVNCQAHMLTTSQGRFHKIILKACRNIKKGEELFFDYGYSEEKKLQIDWMKYFVKKFMFNK